MNYAKPQIIFRYNFHIRKNSKFSTTNGTMTAFNDTQEYGTVINRQWSFTLHTQQIRFNPFTTEPQAILLLLGNDTLDIIN